MHAELRKTPRGGLSSRSVAPIAIAIALGALACGRRGPDYSVPPPTPDEPSSSPSAASSADDLDASIAAWVRSAHRELGADAPVHVEAGVFVLVGDRPGAWFDGAVSVAHKALEAYFHDRFAKAPTRAVIVYAFSSKARFDQYIGSHLGADAGERYRGDLGIYLKDSQELFTNLEPGPATLGHELVHPILQYDFPEAPKWFAEGLASLYENPRFPAPGEIRGADNWRRDDLNAVLTSPSLRDDARLDHLFKVTDEDFRGRAWAYYAVGRYFCQWLEGRGQLWPFYHAWRDGYAGDPSGEKAFAGVVGKTPAEAQAAWDAWARGGGR